MVRRLFLSVLGLVFFSEAVSAQALPVAPVAKVAPQKSAVTGRTLTARERRAAEAAAKTAATKAAATSNAVALATPTAQPGWTGWSDEPANLPQDDVLYHPRTNLSAAPGMPVNQVGHGVTTDYDGHPLHRTAPAAASGTTLPTPR